ncbi:hypothetical protein ACP6PL_06740 [Dapis sp. BLCC M126]|uniref:hypothetical protein n=1 Tax=Dapis sp. BLCC M126 TaxID=3400189 RepID=UPI003CE69B3F
MEPIELTAAAIALPFLTKYMEKAGEGLGEKTAEQVGKLWQVIQRKPADITPVLKSAETEAFPVDFGQAILELEAATNQDAEINQAVIDVAKVAKEESPEDVKKIEAEIEKIKAQGPTVQNYGKLAEEIRNVIQGNTFHGGPGGIHF